MAKLPNVEVVFEPARFSLRSLANGDFRLKVVIGIRDVFDGYLTRPRHVIEIQRWIEKGGFTPGQWVRVEPPVASAGYDPLPYWVLSDGSGNEPRLCPVSKSRESYRPSPRWTWALWHKLAEHLAAQLDFDASKDRFAKLEFSEPADDIEVYSRPFDPESK